MTLTVAKMKGFVVVLLCALATVEPRSTGEYGSVSSAAAIGDAPSFVHLRIAVSTSGLLNTGAGTLIDSRWILTSASNIITGRFAWNRFGTVNVVNPTLVTESSTFIIHEDYNQETGANNIGLISINRAVESSDAIRSARPSKKTELSSGRFCSFGASESGGPGEFLSCTSYDDSNDLEPTNFDSGAGLLEDGEVIAIVGNDKEKFTLVADYIPWIESKTGLSFA